MKKHLLILALLFFLYEFKAQTPRMCLYEEFTGETCPPCASTNPALNATLAANASKIVAIKWQVPIPSAPTKTWSLYQTNKAEINWRYGSNGYGYASQDNATAPVTSPGINSAPSGRIDGQHQWIFGATSDHPVTLTNAVISTAQSYTSAFSITMNRAWNKTCTAINLTVTIQATAPFTSVGALIFRTVMVERNIQFSVQPGTNGETHFEDVAIKSFPTLQQGTPMASTWTLGQTQTFTMSCPLPSYTRKKDEVALVGFIQDDGNKKVAQAARADKAAIPDDAISGVSAQVDLTCTGLITPTVELKNEGLLNSITVLTLTPYIDGVAGTPVPWTGNLAPGASTIVTLNSVTSPALSGNHTFSVDIDMSIPVYNLIKNATKVNYMVAANYQGASVSEGFTTSTYPPPGFGAINKDGGPGWSRNNLTGGYNLSTESTKYDFFTNTVIGDKDELYLPPMDFSQASGAQLFFDVAHAQRNTSSVDQLDILVSDNCGISWTNVYSKNGASLATAAPVGSAYFPDSGDPASWRTDQVDLSTLTQPDVLIKFVTTSDNGNNLYLDNINLSLTTGIKDRSSTSLKVSLFPNPANGTTHIMMNAMKAGAAKITVINTLGQVVFVKDLTLAEGTSTFQLDVKDYAAGVYSVLIDSKNGSMVKKLTVTR